MSNHVIAALIITVGFLTSVFGGERQIRLRWDELAGAVQGKKVQMVLRNGEDVEGKVQAVEPEALAIKISKASGSYEKGLQAIPRSQVSVLRFEGRSGPWRAISTGIGGGTGALFGIGFYQYSENEGGADAGDAAFAAMLIGGGAGLGYLFGRSVDRHIFVVSIIE